MVQRSPIFFTASSEPRIFSATPTSTSERGSQDQERLRFDLFRKRHASFSEYSSAVETHMLIHDATIHGSVWEPTSSMPSHLPERRWSGIWNGGKPELETSGYFAVKKSRGCNWVLEFVAGSTILAAVSIRLPVGMRLSWACSDERVCWCAAAWTKNTGIAAEGELREDKPWGGMWVDMLFVRFRTNKSKPSKTCGVQHEKHPMNESANIQDWMCENWGWIFENYTSDRRMNFVPLDSSLNLKQIYDPTFLRSNVYFSRRSISWFHPPFILHLPP